MTLTVTVNGQSCRKRPTGCKKGKLAGMPISRAKTRFKGLSVPTNNASPLIADFTGMTLFKAF
jgi:hypothetical protein